MKTINDAVKKAKERIDNFIDSISAYSYKRQCEERWQEYGQRWENMKKMEQYEILKTVYAETLDFPEQEKTGQYSTLEVMAA